MGCSGSSSASTYGSAKAHVRTAGTGPLWQKALNPNGDSNYSSEKLLMHCSSIRTMLLSKMGGSFREGVNESNDDNEDDVTPPSSSLATTLDQKTEDLIKAELLAIVSVAKGCQARQEFLRGKCLNDVLVCKNMIRVYPAAAINLRYVLKIALELVEKNMEVDQDSISSRISNNTPFSSTNNLGDMEKQATSVRPPPPGVSLVAIAGNEDNSSGTGNNWWKDVPGPSGTLVVQRSMDEVNAELGGDLLSFKERLRSKSREFLKDQSHHGSTNSFEDFGFFDISTHSAQNTGGARGGQKAAVAYKQRDGLVQQQLSRAIDSGVNLYNGNVVNAGHQGQGHGSSGKDELSGRHHG